MTESPFFACDWNWVMQTTVFKVEHLYGNPHKVISEWGIEVFVLANQSTQEK